MSDTKAIISFFVEETPLPSRYFGKEIDGYKVIYHQVIESLPRLVARFRNGVIEVPQSAVMNGLGCAEWKGNWHQIPEAEFIKDFGEKNTRSIGTINYSA